ncbi:MAG: copper transporter [Bacillota bacterium]|jgi:hypothetical protein
MIDYKYHITTLVAIFLALGIGMLVGSMILGTDFIEGQQQSLVNQLEHDFREMRLQHGLIKSELATAVKTINTYQNFSAQVMPIIIKNKLEEQNIVIVQTNNDFDIQEIIDPLKVAGAKVNSIISIMDDFSLTNVSSSVPSGLDNGNQLIQALGKSILFGDNQKVVSHLAKKKLIKLTGDLGGLIDTVILVGGSVRGEQGQWVDMELLDCFIKNNMNVIGVEPSAVTYSYMNIYQAKHIVTIDNIDTVPGKVALVYSLLGEKGDFGTKKTSKKLIPSIW